MSKKKRKHANHAAAGWGDAGYAAMGGMDNGYGPRGTGGYGAADPSIGQATAAGMDGGLMHNLQGLMGSRQTEQFILGTLIGAAAVYVLGDEELRSKLIRTGVRLFTSVAGGIEEIKEQMADIKAEVAAEKRSAE
jgi:hypothetical protein